MKNVLNLLGVIFLLLSIVFCDSSTSEGNNSLHEDMVESDPNKLRGQAGVQDDESAKDILKIAMSSKDHTTLVAAVRAAKMEHVLTNAGPLTVFAPTNAAFEKLPEGTVENLLKPENISTLANIITFHAAPGNYGPNSIKGVMGIGQATGDKVKVQTENGVTLVNGHKVVASIKASNGYVHVIDGVLLPPE